MRRPLRIGISLKSVIRGEIYLSPRQRDIIQLIAEGRTTKDIARLLDLSIKTIETHQTELMKRLDIHDVAGLVRYPIRRGLISPET